ncbi:hypothetical protein IGJ02_002419 [Enterococcus sp. DIV0724b]|uniref:glycosyltransferase family 2 protein n=1 Tax=Enterococcus sp. DIV0724b TaxID=2774694 RepID=UPI003D2FB12A
MSELVSIIVPIYNVEKYLLECLESLVNQTYKNIEILLIDDGSTDQSREIAQEFCEAHPEFKTQLIVKENGGQSSARNVGIQHAKGTYFIFVDSDDLISSTHVEILYKAVNEMNVKLAMCKFTKNIKELSNNLSVNKTSLKGDFLTLVEKLYASDYHAVSASGKIYHRTLIEEVKFHEGIIYEDGIFFYEIIDKIDEIILVDSVCYYYRTTENSTLISKINKKNFDILKKNELTLSFFKKSHPEALTHFYQKAMNVNDFMAVKCMEDKTILSKDLLKKLYSQNKQYSKGFFPRNIIYLSWTMYYFFIFIISKAYKTNQPDKDVFFKKLVKRVVR